MSEVRSMEPAAAAEVVRGSFGDPSRPATVADVAVRSGLALRDAEAGLTWLTKEYRGHLRVTEDGELLYLFPSGFTRPWIVRQRWQRAFAALARGVLGTLRFVVRAWLLIALVVNALAFVAILIGLSTQRNERSDHRRSQDFVGVLFRALFEALYWTFHPFSPFAYREPLRGRRQHQPDVPLYEKVNRFVFGPPTPPVAPHAKMAQVLQAIRAGKGRIGLSDVLRVTGLPRDEADAMMAGLMLDYEGDVEVGDRGGLYYRFEALRKSAEERAPIPPPAAWDAMPSARPLTGNTAGANVLVAALNGFNLAMSVLVLASDLTVADLFVLFHRHVPTWAAARGVPIAFGVVPLVLSLLVFAIPLGRAMLRPWQNQQRARERGRLAMLREVLARAPKAEPVREADLRSAYRIGAGIEPEETELRERIVELGGDLDVDTGHYRFPDLEEEAAAVAEERERAAEAEARVGPVVFTSES